MTEEGKHIRTFIAVDVDSAVSERLQALQSTLAKSRADVRWVDNSSLHITLKFLGSTPEASIPAVTGTLNRIARNHAPWTIELRGLGAFPSLRRPRVLWVGVLDGGKLAQVARELDEALAPLGFAREERPFQPHLTLCRVRSLQRWEALEEKVKAHLDESFGQSVVQEFILYRSDLRPTGAVYTPLWKTPLGETKGEEA
ncbi:MAG: RNA 2',3'-cyclic phosphodiesterase [Candidatus Binatia bacterium]|nr:RNA 2',3'-cyclic phosphodiesterase [Candidatus Binatia bacterium]